MNNDFDLAEPQQKRELLARLLRQRAQSEVTTSPLSYGQRALWFLYQLDRDSAAYNLMYAAYIRHDVQRPALRKAIQGIADRHAVLRTTYGSNHGQPAASIQGYRAFPLKEVDATRWPESQLWETMQRISDEPFDLDCGPVIRAHLFFRAGTSHVLLMTAHHIAMDFWSFDLLFDDLQKLYRSEVTSSAAALPPLPVQYADYVRWQEEFLSGPEGERLLEYWKEKLAGELPSLDLPTDRPRPPVQTFAGSTLEFELPDELAQQLAALAQDQATTLYTTLLAAFLVLLYRYTGQDDLLVGSPTAGRNHARLEPIVGYFLNPAVLRCRPSAGLPFTAFLTQVRAEVLDSLAHQELPFPLLVERLMPPRDPSRSPIFNVAFAWDKPQYFSEKRSSSTDAGSLMLEPCALGQRGAAFDLMLMMLSKGESLLGALQYNTDLFDELTAQRIAEHLQVLLQSIVRDPHQSLANLPILTESQQHRLTKDWNDTTANYPRSACLHELIEQQAARRPQKVAAKCGNQHLTYGELDHRANQLARHLQERGVGPGVLVALCMDRSLTMLIGMLGILKAGSGYVPFSPETPLPRLVSLLEECSVEILLTQQHLLEQLSAQLPTVECLNCDDLQFFAKTLEAPDRLCQPENLAYVLFTSGSTGQPKGVEIEHRSVVNFLTSMAREPGFGTKDIWYAVTTPTFDISVLELLGPLTVGAQVVVASDLAIRDGHQLADSLERSQATIMQATPATWRLLLASGWHGNHQLKILCGGEALPRDLADQLLDRCGSLWNMYGPTETTIWSAVDRVRADEVAVSIGRPIANTQIYILDRQGQPTPVGLPGDLCIGGDGLARGYLNQPQLTAEKFVPDSFAGQPNQRMYQTGDLARYRVDGRIEFLGRQDSQVKILGHRIELGEIEFHLNAYPAVNQAVVIAHRRGEQEDDKQLVAYLLPESETLNVGELRDYLKGLLPDYMVPAVFTTLNEFPLNAAGKVDRRALLAPVAQRPSLSASYMAPRDRREADFAEIWSAVLGMDHIGIHDNFFELGGASIQSLQIAARAQDIGIQLTPTMLFQYPTVAQLANITSLAPQNGQHPGPQAVATAAGIQRSSSTRLSTSNKARQQRNGKANTQHQNIFIESLGVYLPPKEVSTADVLAGCQKRTWFPLEKMTGIKSRRMAGDTEFSVDLARQAVQSCLDHSRYTAADIDLVVCCNIARINGPLSQLIEPYTAVQLLEPFGFVNAQAIDISNACTGMFTAIRIVEAFIQAGAIRRAIVVSGEYITAITRTAQLEIEGFLDPRLPCLTVGDAGAAVILEAASTSAVGFHELELYTLSRFSRMCVGGLTEQPHGGAIMHVPDPMQHTAVAVQHSVANAMRVLDDSPWSPDQIQHLIMHQTSERSLRDGMRAINAAYGQQICTEKNTINNLAHRGNTATTAHFVALWDNIQSGRIQSGDNIVFGITGSGQTIGTGLYTLDDLPDRLRRQPTSGTAIKANGAPEPWVRRARSRRAHLHAVSTLPLDQQLPDDTIELCVAAAEDCLKKAEYDRSQIELLMFTGMLRTGYVCEPAIASMVAEQLQMNDLIESEDDPKTLAFDVYGGALGSLYACQVAQQMMESGMVRTAMIIASEVEINRRYIPAADLGIQQTASAMILDCASQSSQGFGEFVFHYQPENIAARTAEVRYQNGTPICDLRQAPELWELYLAMIPAAVDELLQREGLNMSQIKSVLPPQNAPGFSARLAQVLEIPDQRVARLPVDHQDLFTSALPYSLQHIAASHALQPGDPLLIIQVGSGIQVGCAMYRF